MPPQLLHVVPPFHQMGEVRIFCKGLRSRGERVLVLVPHEDAGVYRDCADRIVACEDLCSEAAVVAALRPHRDELRGFSALSDACWPAAAGAALELGVGLPGAAGAINARLKPRMRGLLASVLPLPYEVLDSAELTPTRVDEIVDRLELPFVVKPIWGNGSNFVEIVESRSRALGAIEETFAALGADPGGRAFSQDGRTWDPRRQLLLEAFAPGREFSVEGYVDGGELVVLMIQEKLRFERDGGMRYETANVSPAELTANEQELITAGVSDALAALGLDGTFVHVELKWDGQTLNIIEVNPRIGGGSVIQMLEFWTGIDVREAALRLAVGEPVGWEHRHREGFLLGVFVNAAEAGLMRELEGLEWARAQPEFCFENKYHRKGQEVPARGAKGGREGWLYAYDAFFWCHDSSRIDELHDGTRARVRVRCDPIT